MNTEYANFLASKAIRAQERGLAKTPKLAKHLFPFQRACVEHHLRVGAAGCFLDTGLGKTEIQLEFCQKAIEATNQRAIIWTPLAVAGQTKRRAEKWGYEARVIREQSEAGPGINICNYDRREKIDPSEFGVVSCDEASILKSFTGKTTQAMIEAFNGYRFKLVATATPAPNDHMELGNYAEFLEIMAANEMLSRFFINDTSTASQDWRLKQHAIIPFWDWMASWARMAQSPSDITGDPKHDEGFILPPFNVIRHRAADTAIDRDFADLFGVAAMSATNMFDIKRQTLAARATLAVQIVHDGLSRWIAENVGTPSAESVTRPTPSIESNEGIRRSLIKTPDDSTMLTTISGTKTSIAKGKNGERGRTTNVGASDTPLTPSFEKGARQSLGNVARLPNETDTCDQNLDLSRTIISPCSTVKTEHVPSADREHQASESDGFTSIIATPPGASADCFAPIAISGSENLETTPTIYDKRRATSLSLTLPSWVLWCTTNDEQRIIEHELGDLCFSIYGAQSADEKENLHEAWLRGDRPVLLTKPSIFGWGCDWQHCYNVVFVGRSFSYEEYYQAVRRCWRFGQKRQVNVHLVVAEGENEIGRVIDRKANDHQSMKSAMREAMRRSMGRVNERKVSYNPTKSMEVPPWLIGLDTTSHALNVEHPSAGISTGQKITPAF